MGDGGFGVLPTHAPAITRTAKSINATIVRLDVESMLSVDVPCIHNSHLLCSVRLNNWSSVYECGIVICLAASNIVC